MPRVYIMVAIFSYSPFFIWTCIAGVHIAYCWVRVCASQQLAYYATISCAPQEQSADIICALQLQHARMHCGWEYAGHGCLLAASRALLLVQFVAYTLSTMSMGSGATICGIYLWNFAVFRCSSWQIILIIHKIACFIMTVHAKM